MYLTVTFIDILLKKTSKTKMNLDQEWVNFLIWIIALPAGWLLAKIIKMTLFKRLHSVAKNTNNDFDDAVLSALEKMLIPAGIVLGIWIAYHSSNLFPDYKGNIALGLKIFSVLIFTWAVAGFFAEVANVYLFSLSGGLKSSLITNVVKVIIYVVGLLFILNILNISILPALTALGVGGLAVALALQETLSNLFAGIQMLASKKYVPGDYVSLSSGEEGFLEDIAWRNTTIRALGNHIIIVPNSVMAQTIVKNYILPDTQNSVLIGVGVSYDSDLEFVEKVTVEVGRHIMQNVEGAVADHEPFIRYNTFADSSINFNVILRSSDFTSQYIITHEFIKALKKRFDKEGIEIPFPIRTVHMKAAPLEIKNIGPKLDN